MSDELKPCPFCGGEARAFRCEESGTFDVQCQQCGAIPFIGSRTSERKTMADVIAAWNARAERTCEMLEMRTGDPADYADTEEVIWHCQYCHAEMAVYGFDEDGDVWPVKPKYCQNCGAKVTR